MAGIREKMGAGGCFVCGREVVWKKTAGGALSCFCQHCDFQGFAKHGTEAEREILKMVGNAAPQGINAPEVNPEPEPKPAPKSPPKPAPKPGLFGGLGL